MTMHRTKAETPTASSDPRATTRPVVLLVTYDLETGDDYDAVVDAIERLGSAVEIQRSVWIVATQHTVKAAFDHVAIELQPHDRLFIGPLEIGGMWRNALCGNEALLRAMAAGRG
jgi:hypothetical protein